MKEQTAQHNQVKLPHEVFELVSAAKNINERVEILQKHSTFAIKTILQANFKPTVVFDLPEGIPPYRKDEGVAGLQVKNIEKVIYDLKYLTKTATVNKIKKETIFIRMLETCHPKDSEIIIAMKDKKLNELYKGITEATVRKAFPNLL
jgi:hypothetical protein